MKAAQRFGANVKRERERKGLTQEELAGAAGLHPTAISRIEGAVRDPRLSTVIVLAEALDVPPAQLFDGM